MVLRGTLRSKFLLALVLISASLTWATLLLVRHRVELRVRQEIGDALENSVATFHVLQAQRENALERSAALLASLPPLKAVMTSQDIATIQDASATFWDLSGSQLFVLDGRGGNLKALHTPAPGFTRADAAAALARSLENGETRGWWFGNGHLYEMFFQPISFGPEGAGIQMGVLGVGYEIDKAVAADVARVASCRVAFRYGRQVVAATGDLGSSLDAGAGEVQIGHERFLATSVQLSGANSAAVTLTVLKSYDEATSFLESLNRWIVGIEIGRAHV